MATYPVLQGDINYLMQFYLDNTWTICKCDMSLSSGLYSFPPLDHLNDRLYHMYSMQLTIFFVIIFLKSGAETHSHTSNLCVMSKNNLCTLTSYSSYIAR